MVCQTDRGLGSSPRGSQWWGVDLGGHSPGKYCESSPVCLLDLSAAVGFDDLRLLWLGRNCSADLDCVQNGIRRPPDPEHPKPEQSWHYCDFVRKLRDLVGVAV